MLTTQGDFLDALAHELGSGLLQSRLDERDLWVRVDVEQWRDAAQACLEVLGCNYFSFLSGLDWLPNPNLDGEKTFDSSARDQEAPVVITDEAVRMAGGSSRFQVFGRLYNADSHLGVTLVSDLDDEQPTAPSWVPVYKGADWHEREAWEMFGFDFIDHPGLRNIYLPSGFEGYPLRKDFALLARVVRPWPGLVDMEEMPKVETTGGESE